MYILFNTCDYKVMLLSEIKMTKFYQHHGIVQKFYEVGIFMEIGNHAFV